MRPKTEELAPSFILWKMGLLYWENEQKFIPNYKESNELWRISFATQLNDKIHLYSFDVDISLVDIYDEIDDLRKNV